MRLYCAMMLSEIGDDRRDIMATTIQQIHPIAHLPLVLEVLRRLEVATVIDRLIPPHPAHGLSCGRGVEALVLAILDGHHALYKVGRRLEERGMLALLQPGLTRAALNDYRLGHILDALFAANLNGVFSAVALKALEVYALATPWLHQDTTTIALYGAYKDEPQTLGAPRPAYEHSKDGRGDLKQVLLSLGVSGDGGLPLRLGIRDGNISDSVETPVAIEECLALGLQGVYGIVADSKAYSRRTLDLLYASLTIPPVYCHINSFRRVSSGARPEHGGENRTAVWASHHEELCSDGIVAPHGFAPLVGPHLGVALEWCDLPGAAGDAGLDAALHARRAERTADGGVVSVPRLLHGSPRAPRINAQRVARFAHYCTHKGLLAKELCRSIQ